MIGHHDWTVEIGQMDTFRMVRFYRGFLTNQLRGSKQGCLQKVLYEFYER